MKPVIEKIVELLFSELERVVDRDKLYSPFDPYVSEWNGMYLRIKNYGVFALSAQTFVFSALLEVVISVTLDAFHS